MWAANCYFAGVLWMARIAFNLASFEDKIGQKDLYLNCLNDSVVGQQAMAMHEDCLAQKQQFKELDEDHCPKDKELLCAEKFLNFPGLRECIGPENTVTIEATIRYWKVFTKYSCTEEAKSLPEYKPKNASYCSFYEESDLFCDNKTVMPTLDSEYPITFSGFSYNKKYCQHWSQHITCEVKLFTSCFNATAGEIVRKLYQYEWEVTPCENSGITFPSKELTSEDNGVVFPSEELTSENHGIIFPSEEITSENNGVTFPSKELTSENSGNTFQSFMFLNLMLLFLSLRISDFS